MNKFDIKSSESRVDKHSIETSVCKVNTDDESIEKCNKNKCNPEINDASVIKKCKDFCDAVKLDVFYCCGCRLMEAIVNALLEYLMQSYVKLILQKHEKCIVLFQ